jgi:hypothetical protein
MKAKHIFGDLNYRELDELFDEFPKLVREDLAPSRFQGGGYNWKSIPQELRNELSTYLRNKYHGRQ